MGKGDKRSKRGKVHNGTYGVRRPRKRNTAKKTTAPSKRPAR